MLMNTGWNVAVLLYIRHWFFNVLLKRLLSQQNVNNKTIKCNNNVNDSNKNVTNFLFFFGQRASR